MVLVTGTVGQLSEGYFCVAANFSFPESSIESEKVFHELCLPD